MPENPFEEKLYLILIRFAFLGYLIPHDPDQCFFIYFTITQ